MQFFKCFAIILKKVVTNVSFTESEARISQYMEVIKKIQSDSSPQSSSDKRANSYQPSNEFPNSFTGTTNSNEEGEVRIPLAYLLQAKPLFDFLVSNFSILFSIYYFTTFHLLNALFYL